MYIVSKTHANPPLCPIICTYYTWLDGSVICMKNEYHPARPPSWQSWKLVINNLDGNNWGCGDAACHTLWLSLCFSTRWTWGSEICLNCLTSISAHTSWLMPAMFNNDSPYHMCTQAERTAAGINQAQKTLTVHKKKRKEKNKTVIRNFVTIICKLWLCLTCWTCRNTLPSCIAPIWGV